QDDIQAYKKAVVVIETDDSRGTGFSISEDGTIVTNHHVVGDEDEVTVAFPDHGLFSAEVAQTYADIDLAVLTIETEEPLPSLEMAKEMSISKQEKIYFIGNPLRFQGIANDNDRLYKINELEKRNNHDEGACLSWQQRKPRYQLCRSSHRRSVCYVRTY